MTDTRTATFARVQYHIDPTRPPGQRHTPGSPDPRTATCDQHRVASPYSDTAKGDGVAVPESNGWPCVICGTENAELIGTEVIVTTWDVVYVYGGVDLDRMSGMMSTSFNLLGGPHVVKCAVTSVAPADTPINVKDPRITIEKLPKKRDYQDAGPWLPHIDHPAFTDFRPTAKKTKREALAYAARRLAIADYHS